MFLRAALTKTRDNKSPSTRSDPFLVPDVRIYISPTEATLIFPSSNSSASNVNTFASFSAKRRRLQSSPFASALANTNLVHKHSYRRNHSCFHPRRWASRGLFWSWVAFLSRVAHTNVPPARLSVVQYYTASRRPTLSCGRRLTGPQI